MSISITKAIYAANHVDPQTISIIFCKIRNYLVNVSLMTYRWSKMAVCIDRAAICNYRAWSRSFSGHNYHHYLVCHSKSHTSLLSNWVWSLFVRIGYLCQIVQSLCRCYHWLITTYNHGNFWNDRIYQSEKRKQKMTRLRKRDQQLLIFLPGEVILCVLTNLLYSTTITYSAITAGESKTIERIRIESFCSSPSLVIVNNCGTFYLYLLVSSKFRQDLRK